MQDYLAFDSAISLLNRIDLCSDAEVDAKPAHSQLFWDDVDRLTQSSSGLATAVHPTQTSIQTLDLPDIDISPPVGLQISSFKLTGTQDTSLLSAASQRDGATQLLSSTHKLGQYIDAALAIHQTGTVSTRSLLLTPWQLFVGLEVLRWWAQRTVCAGGACKGCALPILQHVLQAEHFLLFTSIEAFPGGVLDSEPHEAGAHRFFEPADWGPDWMTESARAARLALLLLVGWNDPAVCQASDSCVWPARIVDAPQPRRTSWGAVLSRLWQSHTPIENSTWDHTATLRSCLTSWLPEPLRHGMTTRPWRLGEGAVTGAWGEGCAWFSQDAVMQSVHAAVDSLLDHCTESGRADEGGSEPVACGGRTGNVLPSENRGRRHWTRAASRVMSAEEHDNAPPCAWCLQRYEAGVVGENRRSDDGGDTHLLLEPLGEMCNGVLVTALTLVDIARAMPADMPIDQVEHCGDSLHRLAVVLRGLVEVD